MIYRNGEQYKLTAEDIKLVRLKFRKFPLRLKYPEDRVRKSMSKHNILPDKPNSISFPLEALVKTSSGSETWRYAENRYVDAKGKVVFTPHKLHINGTMVLGETDMELIYFLYAKCPYIEGGKNFQGRAKAVFEDLIGKAEEKASREEQEATLKALIYSSKVGLPEKKLREVAKAYFIPGVDEMTFAQVKIAMEQSVRASRGGVETFLVMAEGGDVIEVRAMLQSAIDRGLIKYDPNRKTWFWGTTRGKKAEAIAQVSVSAHPQEALYDFYIGNKDFARNLVNSLKGNKVILPEGNEGNVDDENAQGGNDDDN